MICPKCNKESGVKNICFNIQCIWFTYDVTIEHNEEDITEDDYPYTIDDDIEAMIYHEEIGDR